MIGEQTPRSASKTVARKKVSRLLSWMSLVVTSILIAAGFVFPSRPTQAASPVFTVYMSPTGNDANDGLTTGTSVKTIDRVEAVISQAHPTIDVRVRIKPGTYIDDRTNWSTYIPGRSISFMPLDYNMSGSYSGARPVFRGDGTANSTTWLYGLLQGVSTNTRLVFYFLQIENYIQSGIQISGGYVTDSKGYRRAQGSGANGNVFHGLLIQRIGTKHNASPTLYGYGAIVLANSSYNWFNKNTLQYLENTGSHHLHVHGLYIEHGSSYNTIRNNTFNWISGNPAHARNDSNSNDISGNKFIRTGGNAYYGDYFCDTKNSCVKLPSAPYECASHGTSFYNNDLVSGYSGGSVPTTTLAPTGATYAGGPYCNNEGQPRIKAWGNY